jgi:hypothetical protein
MTNESSTIREMNLDEGTITVFTSQGSLVRVQYRPPIFSNTYASIEQWFFGLYRPMTARSAYQAKAKELRGEFALT